jgi:hypothetical protein
MSTEERKYVQADDPRDATRDMSHDGSRSGGQIVPWEDSPLPSGVEPTRADTIVVQPLPRPAGNPDGRSSVVRVRKSLLLWLLSLLLVAVLVIVALVMLRPGRAKPAAENKPATPTAKAAAAPRQNASRAGSGSATGSPSPAASVPASSAGTTGTTPAAGASPATTIAAAGGGAGSAIVNLASVNPVQNNTYSMTTGPEEIGAVSYADSVRFTCSGTGNLVYNVAGYKFLTTLFGVPSDADNAVGNTMTITFLGDGSTQLGQPISVSLGHPQSVHLDLQGSSQLEIACRVSDNDGMDAALGNATIGPS